MFISSDNYFNNNLQYIQNQLSSKSVSSHAHDTLIERLDEMNDVISKQQEQADPFTLSYLEDLKNKVIFLYGEVNSKLWNSLVHQIGREASLLNNYPLSGNAKRVKLVAEGLKSHLNFLEENYAPALEEKKIISFATKVLSHLSSPTVPKTAISQEDEEISPEIEEILAQMIDCFTQKEFKKAKFLFESLNSTEQEQISALLPQDMLSCFSHNVKTSTNHHPFFLVKG